VSLPAGGIAVTAVHPVLLTGPKPTVFLADLTRSISGGTDIKLVLNFRNAGPVTLLVPVMARAQHYVTYGTPPSSAAASQPAGVTRPPSPAPTPGLRTSPTPRPTA
jgi:hypothetical protein